MSRITMARHVLSAVSFTLAIAVLGGSATGRASQVRVVHMMDACSPSFNVFVGPDICVGNEGGVPFLSFINVLTHVQHIDAWHFSPGVVQLREGEEFQAINDGGEVHTFTEVEEFGGGIVPELNALSGDLQPAPECDPLTLDFILPGGTSEVEEEEEGTELYQCCIHPWMRAVVTVR